MKGATSKRSPIEIKAFTLRFEGNARVIQELVADVAEEKMRWRPAPRHWSMLEVLCHLLDSERDDFRTRLDLLLHEPGRTWPGIDPEGWVYEREYNERSPAETLESFGDERRRSIAWLEGLKNPDWDLRYEHPKLGQICAGSMLAAWLDHDFLHMRQLAHLHHEQLASLVAPYTTGYAGSW